MTVNYRNISWLALGFVMCLLSGCNHHSGEFPGYIDADFTYISSPVGGRLMQLGVKDGQSVQPNQLLYALDPQPEQSIFEQQRANWLAARANLRDSQQGARQTVVDGLQAVVKQAKADYEFAKERYKKTKPLLTNHAVSSDLVQQDRRDYLHAKARLDQAKLAVTDAMLGERDHAIQMALAKVQSAKATMDTAQWRLDQKSVFAAQNAQVSEVYFSAGEYVPPNKPILSLLMPEKIVVIFYLPQSFLPAVNVGSKLKVNCSNCPSDNKATITYISPKAEYTPPVVYTRESPHELVFKIKAHFDKENIAWHPGIPVTIALAGE